MSFPLNRREKSSYFVFKLSSFLPFFCAAATFKYAVNYYIFMMPSLESIFVLLYNIVTLLMLVLFLPLAIMVLMKFKNVQYRSLWPALLIPACVVANIIYVMCSSGDMEILSRSYRMFAAFGTHDEVGFYFAQINSWFGNMSLVLLLACYIRNKQQIISCILASMIVLIFPILVIICAYPSYLGVRQSSFENDMVFGGGLWNIGVVGFGSISWLALALIPQAKVWQKLFICFSVFLFIFVGLAGLSRSLILMLVFSFSVYFFFSRKDLFWMWKLFIILLGGTAFYFFATNITEALLYRFHDASSGTQNIRLQLWQSYLSHYKEVWLIGAPLGSVYNYYRDINLFGNFFLPHSSVINLFIRFGIISVFAYGVLLKKAFFSIHKVGKARACIISGAVAYMTLAFINQTGYQESVFYIMFGLLLAYTRLDNQGVSI